MTKSIGDKVRSLRKSRNVSQEVLCAKLKMPLSTYSNKERLSKFTTQELQTICDILTYPYDYLVSDNHSFNPLQLNFERDDTLKVNQPKFEFENDVEAELIFLTGKEKKLLKKLRSIPVEKRNQILENIDKIIDGE